MATTTKPESTALTTLPAPESLALVRPSHALAGIIYEHAADIVPFLPEGVSLDRVVAGVGLVLSKEPKLARCTPASVVFGVAKIAQWGLEIGETAYLIAYGTEAVPVRDYKGDIQLLIAAGACREVDVHCVYEKEMPTFKCTYGTNGYIEHHPMHRSADRGAMTGAYVIFRLRFGYTKHLFMDVDEIEAVRKKHSKQWASGPLPYWYAWKTVIKRGSKLLPKDPKLAKVLALFDKEDEDLDPALEVHTPIRLPALPADVVAAAEAAPEPIAPATAEESGESATEAQVELMERLAKSHVWTAREAAALVRNIHKATKQQATTLIDKTLAVRGEREAAEKAEKDGDGLPGADDELPF